MSKDYSIESVKQLLTSHGVSWVDEHQNVTQRAIGLCCPWCGDTDFHCGLFKIGCNFTCWRCGKSGPLWALTQRLFGIGRAELERNLESPPDYAPALQQIHDIFNRDDDVVDEVVDPVFPPSRPIDPDRLPKSIERFLRKRRFTIEHCIKYEARYAPMASGGWSSRLVLPIRVEGRLIGCVGRSLLPRQMPRYMNLHGVSLKKMGALYGIDNWQGGRMILVEGPLDVWRLGNESIATFGSSLTGAQRNYIWSKKPDELIFAWDDGTYQSALKIGRDLSALIPSVRVLKLPEEADPDDLGLKAINKLAKKTRKC